MNCTWTNKWGETDCEHHEDVFVECSPERIPGRDLLKLKKAEHQVESRLFLDVVVGEGSTVFELLTSEDEALLVWGNAFFILDLGLDIFDRVRRLNIEGDGLASKSLDKDLHTTTEAQDEVKS